MEPLGEDGGGDGDGGGGGRIFPEHPGPILHAPRDNISRKDSPSLRSRRHVNVPRDEITGPPSLR